MLFCCLHALRGDTLFFFFCFFFTKQDCDHDLVPDEMSSLEKCFACGGPFSPLKWSGVRCEGNYLIMEGWVH